MQEKLDNIINEINLHPEWDLNLKIRYAYIELGKLIHKDTMFFYTIQNNLLSQGKEALQYSIEQIDAIMNKENNFDYSTICRNAAEMLKYIYDNCHIDCEIRRTINATNYIQDDKEITIRHYFIVVTGNDEKKYFLTLNPDLPNIQIGKMTSHFANKIDYLIEKKEQDADGNEFTTFVQNYEGDEIEYSVMTPQEIKMLDEKLGFIKYKTLDNLGKIQLQYTDYFFDMLKKAYTSNEEYLKDLASQTEFFYDLSNLINGTKTFEEIMNREESPTPEELENSCISFRIKDKSLQDWSKIKQFIVLNIIIELSNTYDIPDITEHMDIYNQAIIDENYDLIFNKFKEEFLKKGWNNQKLQQCGLLNPLSKLRQTKNLMRIIDSIATNDLEKAKLIKFKKEVFEGIYNLSLLFVPNEYLPLSKDSLSSTFITHKIILTFNKIFDIGHKTEFNNLELSEQITIIKEILELILQDIKVDFSIPNYNKEKSPMRNRILTTVIFDKNTHKPYYLMCVKNTKIEQINLSGFNPIIYDMQENTIDTHKSLVDIMSDYYVIKDADMKLMIEEIDREVTENKNESIMQK